MGNATNHESENLVELHSSLDWGRSVLLGRGDDQDSQGAAIYKLQHLAHYSCTGLIPRSSCEALDAKDVTA
jgi:hypothetical protein